MSKFSYLSVELGDEVIEEKIITKINKDGNKIQEKVSRLGTIHNKNIFGSNNAFIVTRMDNGDRTVFVSINDQQKLRKTGKNYIK